MEQSVSLRLDLLENFHRLIESLRLFSSGLLADRNLPAWVSLTDEESEQQLSMRDKAARLYLSLWYEDGQDGRETITCPGLIGASADTLQAARDCNQTKDAFKATVLGLKTLGKSRAEALLAELNTSRDAEVARAMRCMGTARLNLKQAYRHIPMLDRKPLKVGFTWSKQGRTIERISIARARQLLERRAESVQRRIELDKLSRLSASEPLARIRPVCPHLRANIVYDESIEPQRRLVQTPLPLLVPLPVGDDLPAFVPVPPEPVGQERLRRSDVRLEDEAFLPSLRIHRYHERYR